MKRMFKLSMLVLALLGASPMSSQAQGPIGIFIVTVANVLGHDTLKVRGPCVEIPRSRIRQIPIFGTVTCVNPFGGGGKPPQKPDGGAVQGL